MRQQADGGAGAEIWGFTLRRTGEAPTCEGAGGLWRV
jgi:hypothetical protein